jgi:hypothetical protein
MRFGRHHKQEGVAMLVEGLRAERHGRKEEKGTFYFSVEELASPPGDLNTTGMIDAI